MNGPRFLPSGKRFGPYCRSRAEASDRSRPFSELVTSRLTTSVRDMACQPAASLIMFVFTAVLMDAARLRRPFAAETLEKALDWHWPAGIAGFSALMRPGDSQKFNLVSMLFVLEVFVTNQRIAK